MKDHNLKWEGHKTTTYNMKDINKTTTYNLKTVNKNLNMKDIQT